jgi:hypothetical protein
MTEMKTKETDVREVILTVISNRPGIKNVDLVLNCMNLLNPLKFEATDYNFELNKLISEHEIVELEYILPHMDYRVKSIYFPKGTVVSMIKIKNRMGKIND